MSSSDSSPVMNAHRKQGQSQNPRSSNKKILQIYTINHTLLSQIAIFTGFVVLFGLFAGKRLDGWNKWFLITAVTITVTDLFFQFHGITPDIKLGIISSIVLLMT